MYNIVNLAQKKCLVLKSYIPEINLLIGPKRHYEAFSYGKLFNAFTDWREKYPHVIKSPNVSDLIFVKSNVTFVKKKKDLLRISVQELHNDIILPISQVGFFGSINGSVKVCLGDMSLSNYMPKHIKPMSNINNITCG